jgi:hypothetical protein
MIFCSITLRKMKRLRFSFLVLFLGLCRSSAFAAGASDFYCAEYPLFLPVYSETVFKACKDGVTKTQGVCTVMANCVFISKEVNESIRTNTKKDFQELTDEEKKKYFKEARSLEWLPSVLTCEGKINDSGQSVCPVPEKCRGDFSFHSKSAVMNQGEYDAIVRRQRGDNPGGFTRTLESTSEDAK